MTWFKHTRTLFSLVLFLEFIVKLMLRCQCRLNKRQNDNMVIILLPDTFWCSCSNYRNSMSMKRIECFLLIFWSESVKLRHYMQISFCLIKSLFFVDIIKHFGTVDITRCWTHPGAYTLKMRPSFNQLLLFSFILFFQPFL